MVVTRDHAAPKLSDKPILVTLSAHLVMMAASLPIVLGGDGYIPLGHMLYLSFLITGLIAFGTLLLAMLLRAAWASLCPLMPAKRSREATPRGRLAGI